MSDSEEFELEGWTLETRECQNCKNFKDFGFGQIPICTEKLMSVTKTLKVYYPNEEGTCFEPLTQTNDGR